MSKTLTALLLVCFGVITGYLVVTENQQFLQIFALFWSQFVSINDFDKILPRLGTDPSLGLHIRESDTPWQMALVERVCLS